jgi:hypothetical protein
MNYTDHMYIGYNNNEHHNNYYVVILILKSVSHIRTPSSTFACIYYPDDHIAVISDRKLPRVALAKMSVDMRSSRAKHQGNFKRDLKSSKQSISRRSAARKLIQRELI